MAATAAATEAPPLGKSEPVMYGATPMTTAQHVRVHRMGDAVRDACVEHTNALSGEVVRVFAIGGMPERREYLEQVLVALALPYTITDGVDANALLARDPLMTALTVGWQPSSKHGTHAERAAKHRDACMRKAACTQAHIDALELINSHFLKTPSLVLAFLIEDDVAIWDNDSAIDALAASLREFFALEGPDTKYALYAGVSFWPKDTDGVTVSGRENVEGSPHLVKLTYAYGGFAMLITRAGSAFLMYHVVRMINMSKIDALKFDTNDVIIARLMEAGGFYGMATSVLGAASEPVMSGIGQRLVQYPTVVVGRCNHVPADGCDGEGEK